MIPRSVISLSQRSSIDHRTQRKFYRQRNRFLTDQSSRLSSQGSGVMVVSGSIPTRNGQAHIGASSLLSNLAYPRDFGGQSRRRILSYKGCLARLISAMFPRLLGGIDDV